ncbi:MULTISPECIES: pheST operon leader peptide PheM [Enterobacterales]|nr:MULTISPECIES: pheST operon leader peptide PheM [Enterobacterales]NHV08963.1 pheST operon leader peptide PheM [Cronobacter turicensis]NHV62151.1 pheST operon leader peptide PheM [Cronobacter turicensis]NHW09092.1 pheST operon leader peptide PheM [Cronobacter turicensis]
MKAAIFRFFFYFSA